ncbi:MOSC domain-containing protein [Paenibacillus macerans]|uniref:MOSC domain-containing protein n=1 Tax=Paenibacillus macerans TaxID=44252 RepID=UPI002E23284A|nr:MOSC domain-containing protein [Paenibacillus macerans]MED4957373.1 MOSC domain-containing protein [Paenibacillus macerans]
MTTAGKVEAIYLAGAAGEDMFAVNEAYSIPGMGLKGDRYWRQAGTWSKRSPDRDLTLIDTAVLRKLESEFGIALTPGEHRRNIETSGIALEPLIGQTFSIGPVRLLGVRVCNPCAYLEQLTGKKGLLKGLMNSGLFVRILTEGTISVGDPVYLPD